MITETAANAAWVFFPSQLATGTSNGLELLCLAITVHLESCHPCNDVFLQGLDVSGICNIASRRNKNKSAQLS